MQMRVRGRARSGSVAAAVAAAVAVEGLWGPQLVWAPAAVVDSTEVFVAADGEDSGDCATPETACASIGYAIGQTAATATIHVGPGEFQGPTVAEAKDLTVVGSADGTTIVSTINRPSDATGSLALEDLSSPGSGDPLAPTVDIRGGSVSVTRSFVDNRSGALTSAIRVTGGSDLPTPEGTVAFTATGTPAPTYALSEAPQWLSLDSATGVMAAVPPADAVGAHTFTVTATNVVGDVGQEFTLTVEPAPITGFDLGVSPATVPAGGEVRLTGGGGLPEGARVDFVLRSDPVDLGGTTVTADGTFTHTATIAEETEPGEHDIVATVSLLSGDRLSETTAVTVTAPAEEPTDPPADDDTDEPALPDTGGLAMPLVLGALVLMLAGAGLFAGGRTARV